MSFHQAAIWLRKLNNLLLWNNFFHSYNYNICHLVVEIFYLLLFVSLSVPLCYDVRPTWSFSNFSRCVAVSLSLCSNLRLAHFSLFLSCSCCLCLGMSTPIMLTDALLIWGISFSKNEVIVTACSSPLLHHSALQYVIVLWTSPFCEYEDSQKGWANCH